MPAARLRCALPLIVGLLLVSAGLLGASVLAPVAGALSFGPRADFATGTDPEAVTVADVDGDGHLDILTADFGATQVSVLYGTGSGTFGGRRAFETNVQPSRLACADFDLDGHVDVALSHSGFLGAGVLWATGSAGTLAMSAYGTGAASTDIAVADFNDDGDPDLALNNPSNQMISILLGDGERDFSTSTLSVSIASPTALVAGDFDNDGNQDLFVAGQLDDGRVYLGSGAGTFSAGASVALHYETNPISMAPGDLNGDGNEDIAVAAYGNGVASYAGDVQLLMGDGTGAFPMPSGSGRLQYDTAITTTANRAHTTGVAIADFDGDGLPDLAASNAVADTVGVIRNAGDSAFGDLLELPARANPSAVATGDFNEDGRQDVVVTSSADNAVCVWLGRFEMPSGSIAVGDGASATASRIVHVTASVAQATEMRLRVAGEAWGQWQAFAPSTYVTLPAGDGSKTVEAQYRNPMGVTPVMSDAIKLDTTAPATTIAGALTPGWIQLAVITVGLEADDGAGSGVARTQYKVGDTGDWVIGASALVHGTGEVKLWYRSVDAVGNVEDAHCQTFPLDATAPVTVASNVPAGWQRTPFTIFFGASDTGSGVAETNLAVWSPGIVPIMGYGSFVTVNREGTNTVEYRSVDQAGNLEAWKSATVYLDTTAPETTDDAPAGWLTASPRTVTLTATDGEDRSGVAATQYELDGAGWSTGASVEVAGDGEHTLTYCSTDMAGNVGEARTCAVRIDTARPVTTVTGSDSAWHRDAVTLGLSGADATSGVAKTEYTTDGGATWIQGAALTVRAEGTTTVGYRSLDVAGNVEQARTAEVKIDRTAPTTTDDADSGWLAASPVTVHLTPADEGGSGVATTQYKLDGAAAWSTGASVQVAGDGVHTLTYRSTDKAGNVGESGSCTVRVDATPPQTTVLGAGSAWRRDEATLAFSAGDSASGVTRTEYTTDGGATWIQGAALTVSAEGTTTVGYRSTDACGNVEATKTTTVRIDRTAPATTDDAPAGWQTTSPRFVHLSATDPGGSGVTQTQYKLDGAAVWSAGDEVAVAGDGVHTLRYRSLDAAGNIGDVESAVVRVDATAPQMSIAGADDAWHAGPVFAQLDAADATSGVAATEYRLDGAGSGWAPGFGLVIADEAGNTSAVRVARVRIDLTAPTTHAEVPADWTNGATVVELAAADALSGMSGGARTEYSLDGGATWTAGTSVTVAPDAVGHTTDGQEILYRSVDVAGNVEQAKRCVVRIDTCAPVTFGRPVTAKRGAQASFAVAVTDVMPGSPTASVVIRIRSKAGKLVRTLPAARLATNAAARVKWAKCKLAAGTYRYEVLATDAAGNVQSRAGGNKLTVK
jgi:hypothetical protein